MRQELNMNAATPDLERIVRIGAETFGDDARGWQLTYEWNPCHSREGDPPTRVLRVCGGVLLVLFHPEKTLGLSDNELREELRTAWDEEFALVPPGLAAWRAAEKAARRPGKGLSRRLPSVETRSAR